MCSRNILIIIFQIVNNITLILQSNYRSNNAEIDKHFASILWMNRTDTDKSKNNHKIQNIREFSLMAQKRFYFSAICIDLIQKTRKIVSPW